MPLSTTPATKAGVRKYSGISIVSSGKIAQNAGGVSYFARKYVLLLLWRPLIGDAAIDIRIPTVGSGILGRRCGASSVRTRRKFSVLMTIGTSDL